MSAVPSYTGSSTRTVAVPLGGIGTGQVSVCGDGSLRQWEIFNQVNHRASLPNSFFALRVSRHEPPLNVVRVLQSSTALGPNPEVGLSNDGEVPGWQRELLSQFQGVSNTTISGPYPLANVEYEDPELPVSVRLTAYSPFAPLDADSSSLPGVRFNFSIHNPESEPVEGVLGAALQNAVGWDGLVTIDGSRCPLYGGNVNTVRVSDSRVDVVMENPGLPDDHPGYGQMVLSGLTPGAIPYERWENPADFMRFIGGNLVGRQPFGTAREYLRMRHQGSHLAVGQGPSPAGQTWNAGLAVPFRLTPGETLSVTFVLAWHFANRYLNFDQYTWERRDYGKSRFWLGNAYAERYGDAVAVVDRFEAEGQALEDLTLQWADELSSSALSPEVTDLMAAQGALIRSPTCFQTADGRFYGFEGSLGVSTQMWTGDFGGSCPLNCTHVWNYEQALSRWFPGLERSMRDTEFQYLQAPQGYIPHRLILPLYLRQLWDETIGGPENPALDGMLGSILKSYREVRQGAGVDWLRTCWPNLERLLGYIRSTWDPEDDGVLLGEQPNTFDISFYGKNMFIGSLWLASLRAMEEMARAVGDEDHADELGELFRRGSNRYDRDLWNGEYYEQVLEDHEASLPHQWGPGCLSDQLIGQWWAHQLDLGYLLPEEHVKSALSAVVRYNWREDFSDFRHGYRVFAEGDDAGLVVCSWPKGGRPDVPVRYADEVWLGTEYQVAAHCLMEGLEDQASTIMEGHWGRHNGRRRNPFNGVECGDHYARGMAGWSLAEALSGVRYDAMLQSLKLTRGFGSDVRYPFVIGSAWGTLRGRDDAVSLKVRYGSLTIRQVSAPVEVRRIEVDGRPVEVDSAYPIKPDTEIALAETLSLEAGSELVFRS